MAKCGVTNIGGGCGISSDEVSAAKENVLSGKTYVGTDTGDEIGTGTMANNGATGNQSLNAGSSFLVKKGYHEQDFSVGANNLASQTSGTASAGRMLSGQTAWVNGNKITGTIPYQNADISGTDRAWATNISCWEGTACMGVRNAHYLNGVNWIQGNIPNFYAGNIKKGVNIGGVIGSFEGWIGTDTDLYYNGNNKAGFTITPQGSHSSGSFETGMTWLKFGGNNDICLRPSRSYNLSLYSKINLYFMAETGWSNGYVIRLEDYPDITTTITNITAGGYYTASLNIAGFNATILPKILMWAWGSGTTGANYCRIYLYRIYLS